MIYNRINSILIIGVYLHARLLGIKCEFDPPILLSNGERKWTVSDTAPVGTQIGQFFINEKNKNVTFELVMDNKKYEDLLIVDKKNGKVRLNKPLDKMEVNELSFHGFAKAKRILYPVKTEFILVINHSDSDSTSDFPVSSTISSRTSPMKEIPIIVNPMKEIPIIVNPHIERLHNITNNEANVSYKFDSSSKNNNMALENQTEPSTQLAWIPIAIPLMILIVIIPSIGVFIWYIKYKHNKNEDPAKNSDFNDPVYHLSGLQPPLQRAFTNRYIFNATRVTQENQEPSRIDINNSKWEFPRQNLTVQGSLGEGCFGQVWAAEALSLFTPGEKVVVAIKTLKENAEEKEKEDLLSELEVMKILDPHPNVIRLLGCCTEEEPIFVIMEHMPYGKLQAYLRERRVGHYYGNNNSHSETLSALDLTSFAYQVAKGMQYLSSKGILHRDLAARNILVGDNKLCKVSDFGLARDVIDSHIYERKSEGRLPIRWMAPESLFDNIFTTKSDVWSFGILVWEIVTLGSTPYPGMSASEVIRKVKEGYRLEKPDHCKRELYNIMYYCWDPVPEQRPTFGELCDLLENIMQTNTDYIDLNQFPDHSYYNILSPSSTDEKL